MTSWHGWEPIFGDFEHGSSLVEVTAIRGQCIVSFERS